ncbi:DNA polymerase III subunit delta [Anoxybacter fermentans]|uniref:DNA polymerase III subunit delta n=1 Tax=Anoxybacter fermentans TaxID=1323375 RepID=A0A3Q9HQD7_9FIRM|nr:DNA polymerase III subunit delta [Anoxybacter fermentans]AZR73184.1 DNA polymerase III subunit delta [Anoxybacter fermentans]
MEWTERILKAKLEDLKPVYLLFGNEPYLIDEFVSKFIKRFVDPGMKDFMLSYINEENEEDFDNKLYEVCHTVSMLSPYRIVVARCKERLIHKKDERILTKLFKDFPKNTILLLISKNKPDGRLSFVKLIKEIGEWIEFEPLKYQNLDMWIEQQFAKEGKKVAKNGINFLEEHFHNNLQRLKSEIEKVVIYVGDKEFVTLDDIKAVISKDAILKENIIFDLVDAVGNRQIKKALLILEDMEREGESLFMILKMFIRQLHLIMFSKEMSEKGFPPEDTAKRLGQHPYPIKKCYKQARNFTMTELELALERMLQANYDIVTGKYPEKMALQLALIDMKNLKSN